MCVQLRSGSGTVADNLILAGALIFNLDVKQLPILHVYICGAHCLVMVI